MASMRARRAFLRSRFPFLMAAHHSFFFSLLLLEGGGGGGGGGASAEVSAMVRKRMAKICLGKRFKKTVERRFKTRFKTRFEKRFEKSGGKSFGRRVVEECGSRKKEISFGVSFWGLPKLFTSLTFTCNPSSSPPSWPSQSTPPAIRSPAL